MRCFIAILVLLFSTLSFAAPTTKPSDILKRGHGVMNNGGMTFEFRGPGIQVSCGQCFGYDGMGFIKCVPNSDGPCYPFSNIIFVTSGYASGIVNEAPTLWDDGMSITGATVLESHFLRNGNLEVSYSAVGSFHAHFGSFDEWYGVLPDCAMRDISMPDTPWRIKAVFTPTADPDMYYLLGAKFRTD